MCAKESGAELCAPSLSREEGRTSLRTMQSFCLVRATSRPDNRGFEEKNHTSWWCWNHGGSQRRMRAWTQWAEPRLGDLVLGQEGPAGLDQKKRRRFSNGLHQHWPTLRLDSFGLRTGTNLENTKQTAGTPSQVELYASETIDSF